MADESDVRPRVDATEERRNAERKGLFQRRSRQYVAAAIACLGGFSLGCGLGWSAPCVEILKKEYEFDVFSTNVIAATFPVGAALGMLFVPLMMDRIGRKRTMVFLTLPFSLGWCIMIFADTLIPLFVVGRFITGACGGMYCVLSPMYSAEIAEKQIRGRLGVFFQLLLVIGILYAFCSGFCRNVFWISSFCSFPVFVFLVLMLFMPESPLFYLMVGKEEAAIKTMRYFRGQDYDIGPEIEEFKIQVEQSKTQKLDIHIFLKKPLLKSLAIAYGLMFAQQFSGINAVIFYGVTIFESTGVEMDALLQLVIFAVVQVVACVASALLIDKLGRKILMIISMGVMCACLVALALFFIAKSGDSSQMASISWLPLTSICIYILAFCFGAGPIPWAYMGEIFPAKLKGSASSSAAFLNWMMAFIVTVTFETAVQGLGNAIVLFFFAVICGLSVAFVIFFMVETKGKTLVEIQKEFGTFDLE